MGTLTSAMYIAKQKAKALAKTFGLRRTGRLVTEFGRWKNGPAEFLKKKTEKPPERGAKMTGGVRKSIQKKKKRSRVVQR